MSDTRGGAGRTDWWAAFMLVINFVVPFVGAVALWTPTARRCWTTAERVLGSLVWPVLAIPPGIVYTVTASDNPSDDQGLVPTIVVGVFIVAYAVGVTALLAYRLSQRNAR